jgi:hypothetical protein
MKKLAAYLLIIMALVVGGCNSTQIGRKIVRSVVAYNPTNGVHYMVPSNVVAQGRAIYLKGDKGAAQLIQKPNLPTIRTNAPAETPKVIIVTKTNGWVKLILYYLVVATIGLAYFFKKIWDRDKVKRPVSLPASAPDASTPAAGG